MYGPYSVLGWNEKEPFKSLGKEQMVMGWFSVSDGTMPVSLEEHHVRNQNKEDASRGELNLYIGMVPISTVTFEAMKDSEYCVDHLARAFESGKTFLYDFFVKQFETLWNEAVSTGKISIEYVEKELGRKIEHDWDYSKFNGKIR